MLEVSQKLTKSVTVYSHSLDNALVLSGKEGTDFHLLGRFYSKNRFYYSLHEAQLLQHLQFDLAFFGAASLSQGVVSYEDEEDVAVKQLAMQAAEIKILIAESDKYENIPNISWARLKTLTTGLQIRNLTLIWSSLLKIK